MTDIQTLLQQRKKINDRIKILDNETKQPKLIQGKRREIETTIGLLMKRKHKKDKQIYLTCNHQFGEPDYGYKTCNICGIIKASRHA